MKRAVWIEETRHLYLTGRWGDWRPYAMIHGEPVGYPRERKLTQRRAVRYVRADELARKPRRRK